MLFQVVFYILAAILYTKLLFDLIILLYMGLGKVLNTIQNRFSTQEPTNVAQDTIQESGYGYQDSNVGHLRIFNPDNHGR